MKNVLEFCSNFNNYKENIRIEVWYGENAQWRSHVINYFGKPGEYGMFKVDVEKFFDYVASLIPEMYRTDRIKRWLESAPTVIELRHQNDTRKLHLIFSSRTLHDGCAKD